MKKFRFIPTSIFFGLIVVSSCHRDNLQKPNPPTDSVSIFGTMDSSLLIKSITYSNADSSTTLYFFYDTAHRKIIVSLQPVLTVGGDYSDGQEFSYDLFGMLIHITGKFSAENDGYFSSADYVYDDQHVLKSANTTLFGGLNYSASYTKTAVAGGYLLSELYASPGNNGYTDSNYSAALINDSGRLAANYTIYNTTAEGDLYNTSPNGDTYFYYSDSSVYDAAGNLSKRLQTYPPNTLKPDSLVSFEEYNFTVRDTKGDQLHNLGRILFNGIGDLPFSIIDFFAGELSPLGEDGMQFDKYPALQTTVIVADSTGIFNTTLHFSTPAVYDDKSRLIKYHNFAHFSPYVGYDLSISYYK